MEPCGTGSEPGFLDFVRDGAHRSGALLIFDEITIGWRLWLGGAHLKFGVARTSRAGQGAGQRASDRAVIGTRAAMAGAHTSFISSTYWTEGVGRRRRWRRFARCSRSTSPARGSYW